MGEFTLSTSEPPTEEDILATDEQNDLAEMDADEELRLLAENPLPPEGPELEYRPLESDDEDMTDLQSLPERKECITPPLERSSAASNPFRGPIANSSMISPPGPNDDQGASFGSFEETVIQNTRQSPHDRAMHQLRQRQKESNETPPVEWGGAITRTSSIAASVTSEIRRNLNDNLNFQSGISVTHSKQRALPNSNGNSSLNTTDSGLMEDATIRPYENRVSVKTEPLPDGMELQQRNCRKLQDRVQGCLDFGRHLLSRESLRHLDLSDEFTREEQLAAFFEKTVGDLKNKIDRKYEDYINAVQLQREMELKKLEHESERKLTALLHSAGVLKKISAIETCLEKESEQLELMVQDPMCNINYNYDAKKAEIDSTRQAFIACRNELFAQTKNIAEAHTVQSSRVLISDEEPLFCVRYHGRTPTKEQRKEAPKEGAIDLSRSYPEPPTSCNTPKVSTMPSRRAMSKRSRTEGPIHNDTHTNQRPRKLPSRGYALTPEDDWEGGSSRSSAEGFF